MGKYLNNKYNKILFALAGIFLFVLPVPHILIVRETALFISILIIILALRRNKTRLLSIITSLRAQTLLFVLFLFWVLILALFITDDSKWAFKEIQTQWVMGLLALIFGAGGAALSVKERVLDIRALLTIIFWALAVHVLIIDIDGIHLLIRAMDSGVSFQGLTAVTAGVGGLTIGPIDASLLASLLFVFLLSEAISRTVYKKKLLQIPLFILLISLFLVLLASLLTGVRNIVEVPAVIAGALLVLLAYGGAPRKKALYALLLLVPLAISVVVFIYNSDKRWAGLLDTFSVVMAEEEPARIIANIDTAHYDEFSRSISVNISNYVRLAKYRVALNVIRENPLGIGFGRNAFGHYLKGRYRSGAGFNSDSSLLDITIGTGLVGVALFGALIFSMLAVTFRAFINRGDFYALLLYLVIICFSARMVFDSVLRDHFLEMFMFITGLLITSVALRSTRKLKSSRTEA